MSLSAILQRRLVVVTGKGGVGRTTLAAALGVAAGRAGRRTAVIELGGVAEVAEAFGLPGRSYFPREAAPRVDTFSLTARECLDDFASRKLGLGMFARRIVNNRVTRAFFEAVPGLHDLQQVGKIENLIADPRPDDPHYDTVIVDAPATGHGLTLLASARSMREMTRVGPFAELSRVVEDLIADPTRTAVVLVTLPETLPVHESLELADALDEHGSTLGAVVVNQVRPAPLPDSPPWADVRGALVAAGAPWDRVAELGDRAVARDLAQRLALGELASALPGVAVFQAPLVAGHAAHQRVLAVADGLAGSL